MKIFLINIFTQYVCNIINRCSSLKDQKTLHYANGNELLITSPLASFVIDIKESREKIFIRLIKFYSVVKLIEVNVKLDIVLHESIHNLGELDATDERKT
jgi:hypothetical protein